LNYAIKEKIKKGKSSIETGNLTTPTGGGILNAIQGRIGERIFEYSQTLMDDPSEWIKIKDSLAIDYVSEGKNPNFLEVKILKEKLADEVLYAKALRYIGASANNTYKNNKHRNEYWDLIKERLYYLCKSF
jgi:hypothetical protein